MDSKKSKMNSTFKKNFNSWILEPIFLKSIKKYPVQAIQCPHLSQDIFISVKKITGKDNLYSCTDARNWLLFLTINITSKITDIHLIIKQNSSIIKVKCHHHRSKALYNCRKSKSPIYLQNVLFHCTSFHTNEKVISAWCPTLETAHNKQYVA